MVVNHQILEILRVLAHPLRLGLLFHLYQSTGYEAFDVESLIRGADVDTDQLLVAAHHQHLPLLDDVGLVDWNREDDTITRGSSFEDARPFIDILFEDWRQPPCLLP